MTEREKVIIDLFEGLSDDECAEIIELLPKMLQKRKTRRFIEQNPDKFRHLTPPDWNC